jgi:hypothetical protein
MKVKSWTVLGRANKALESKRVLNLTYRKADGTVSVRDVEPLCLYTCPHGYINLMGFCRLRQDYRSFRLDRVVDSTLKYKKYEAGCHATALMVYVVKKAEDLLISVGGYTVRGILEKMISDRDLIVVNL